MRYIALACDYDGTLAHDGNVDDTTVEALQTVRDTGRKLILVTGRELDDLIEIFPQLELFDLVVAENGALLYRPENRQEFTLAEPPPLELIRALKERGVTPLSAGRVIIATREPHQSTALDAIHELGLEHQVIFNKGAVMILPPGVNKASGLSAALEELNLSHHNVVAVGDAENDQSLFDYSECAVAVANAVPSLKERADWVTEGDHGAGVIELIERLVTYDLEGLALDLTRHDILLGTRESGEPVFLKPYGAGVLVAGPSGSGKSTLTTGILERLVEPGYQLVLVDPEGDYEAFEGPIYLGDPKTTPSIDEVLRVLAKPGESVATGLLGIQLRDRPGFFESLLPRLQELRSRSGRPHWIVVDEAHHLLPASWDPASITIPQELNNMLLITVHPQMVAPAILSTIGVVIAVGESPQETIRGFCEASGDEPPEMEEVTLESGEVYVWLRQKGEPPFKLISEPPRVELQRHRRKYAEGELIPEEHFFFRGPHDKLNLRAQNLVIFTQLAEGVDDETWLFHLHQGDYSNWFRAVIKDDELAADAERVERQTGLSADESRDQIKAAIEERYTLPVE